MKFHDITFNDLSYHASNLNIFGRFVFKIFLKILLGALGLWLSIHSFRSFEISEGIL